MRKKHSRTSDARLSRRNFARSAVLAAAAAPAVNLVGSAAASNAEAAQADDPQVQAIFAKIGSRLSPEEKADVRRLVAQMKKTGDALKSFPLDNSDEPATIFHPYRKANGSQPITRTRRVAK